MAQAFRIFSQSERPASYPAAPVAAGAHVVRAVGPCIDLPGAFTFLDVLSPRVVARQLGEAIAASQQDGQPVILYLSSHGGGMEGVEALAQYIADSPVAVHAYVAGNALSAGYYIASACASITLEGEGSQVGSVGAYVRFVDERPAYRRAGVTVEDIYADRSTRKNLPYREALEGDYQRLKDEVLAPVVDGFVSFVEAHRPGAKVADFGAGQVLCGPAAVSAGLADGIEPWPAYIARMATPVEQTEPDVSNPDVSNPDVSNPDVSNPDVAEPDGRQAGDDSPDADSTPLRTLARHLGYAGMERSGEGVYLSEAEILRLADQLNELQGLARRMPEGAAAQGAFHAALQAMVSEHEAERQRLEGRIGQLEGQVLALRRGPAEDSARDGVPPAPTTPAGWRETFQRLGW